MKYKTAMVAVFCSISLACHGMLELRQRKKPQSAQQKEWSELPVITDYDIAKANVLETVKKQEASFANPTTNFLCCIAFATMAWVFLQPVSK